MQPLIFGENCQDLTLINLADLDPGKQLLERIAELPQLEVLILGGQTITDEPLRHVRSENRSRRGFSIPHPSAMKRSPISAPRGRACISIAATAARSRRLKLMVD